MRRYTWLEASSGWSPTLSASCDLPLPLITEHLHGTEVDKHVICDMARCAGQLYKQLLGRGQSWSQQPTHEVLPPGWLRQKDGNFRPAWVTQRVPDQHG